MKILFLSYTYWPPDFGGELLITIERLEALARRGHQPVVLTSGKLGHPSRESLNGVQIKRSPAVGNNRFSRLIRRIVYVIWANLYIVFTDFDIVHYGSIPGINKLTISLIGLVYSFLFKVKGIPSVFVHSLALSKYDSFAFSGLAGHLFKHFISLASLLISVSSKLHADACREFHSDKSKKLLLPYGVRDDIFVPLSENNRHNVRSDLKLDQSSVVFSFLGSVNYRKGFDLLAEAYADLSSSYPHWRLVVIGPISRSQSQNLVDSEVDRVISKIKDNTGVLFLGRIDDRQRLAQIIGSSDIFVFPSRREGMGIAPMEAMAAGVPPIIAKIPGITDQVNIHEETGLYISVDSVVELKDAMVRLGTDEALRRQYGRAARRRIEQHFSWEDYIDKWEALYSELIHKDDERQRIT